MSDSPKITDKNGNEINSEKKTYQIDNIVVEFPTDPADLIKKALAVAKMMAGQAAANKAVMEAQQTAQLSGLNFDQSMAQATANQAGNEAARDVTFPFEMEPAAGAVFALLSMHIETLQQQIDALQKQVSRAERLAKDPTAGLIR